MGVKLAVLAVALDIFFPKKKLETHLTAQIIGRMEREDAFSTQSFLHTKLSDVHPKMPLVDCPKK